MKKLLFILATLAVVVMFTSASNNVKGGLVGSAASDFTISNDDGKVSLSQYRGKYVLLTLWSSADALSRLDNIRCDRYVAEVDGVVQLSVNFDRSKALFNELVATDGLDSSTQYFCESQDRSVFEQKWGTGHQYNTYLISPSGTVVAVNPTNREISRLVN